MGSDGDVDAVVLAAEFLKLDVPAHVHLGADGDAQGEDGVDLLVQLFPGEAVAGDTVAQHTAQLAALFVHIHLVIDIPGYIALINAGRCEDAIRLIRKDNPFPVACAYICEHPCEARCRRNMIDDAMNIRGLKRYAVDKAGDVAQPLCAAPTGKRVAVIGGGPGGLSAAYYLALG